MSVRTAHEHGPWTRFVRLDLRVRHTARFLKAVFTADELNCTERQFANCSARAAALQPIGFVMLARVTNNASRNWVNLVQVSSVLLL